ncbi:MAG: WXG100 family type VII secretion target [Acidimicrobiales bacterium]
MNNRKDATLQTPVGDATALDQAASTCRQRGSEIYSLASSLANETTSTSWVGPRADRFRNDMGAMKHNLDSIAAELETLASQFLALAREVEGRMNLLQQIEQDVLRLFDSFEPLLHTSPPWQGTPWNPGNLPGPFDPKWEHIAKVFGL